MESCRKEYIYTFKEQYHQDVYGSKENLFYIELFFNRY